MSSEKVDSFRQFTGADAETARSFLNMCEDNLEMAVSLYLDAPNSIQNNSVQSANVDEYRSPIPQRTERLIPMEEPVYSSHLDRGFSRRPRRRAFVADDSDEEIQLLGDNLSTISDSVHGSSGAQNGSSLSNASHDPQAHVSSGINNGQTSTNGSRLTSTRTTSCNKRGYLRQLYQPPVELLFDGSILSAQAAAREKNQWLLVSLHDEGCFDCHLLNRDVWKDPRVYQTVKRNFTFLQIPIDSPEGIRFRNLHSYVQSASHISILNPYTGEQKMVWMHLKDAATVHEVLTEFLQHTKLQCPSDSVATDARNLQPSHSRTQLTFDSSPRNFSGATSRLQHPDSIENEASPFKRPRLASPGADGSKTLTTRVARVSLDTGTTGRVRPVRNPLDLSEDEQLRLAIEASASDATCASSSIPKFARPMEDQGDAFIVLSDEDDEYEETAGVCSSGPDLDDTRASQTNQFVSEHTVTTTSTATISCRRPLRPTTSTTVATHDSLSCKVSSEQSRIERYSHNSSPPRLPEPDSGDPCVELAIRFPNGCREVFRLSCTLTLQALLRYFSLRGFSQARYELVRLYPHRNLSRLSDQTMLGELGLAKRDTLFLQER